VLKKKVQEKGEGDEQKKIQEALDFDKGGGRKRKGGRQ